MINILERLKFVIDFFEKHKEPYEITFNDLRCITIKPREDDKIKLSSLGNAAGPVGSISNDKQ